MPWRSGICCALLCLLFLGSSQDLWAHQQRAAITQVLHNPRTGNLEVAHRFYLHDAEHAVELISGNGSDIYTSQQTQQRFYQHVLQNFEIETATGPMSLTPLGYEIEAPFFWVYLETPLAADLEWLRIRHSSLQDMWPDQVNMVNVEQNGETQTATFDGSQQKIVIEF